MLVLCKRRKMYFMFVDSGIGCDHHHLISSLISNSQNTYYSGFSFLLSLQSLCVLLSLWYRLKTLTHNICKCLFTQWDPFKVIMIMIYHLIYSITCKTGRDIHGMWVWMYCMRKNRDERRGRIPGDGKECIQYLNISGHFNQSPSSSSF